MKTFKQHLNEQDDGWKVSKFPDMTVHHHIENVNGHKVHIVMNHRHYKDQNHVDVNFSVNNRHSANLGGVEQTKDKLAILNHVKRKVAEKTKKEGFTELRASGADNDPTKEAKKDKVYAGWGKALKARQVTTNRDGVRIMVENLFEELLNESVFGPHNSVALWRKAAPVLAQRLKSFKGKTVGVHARELGKEFPEDLIITAGHHTQGESEDVGGHYTPKHPDINYTLSGEKVSAHRIHIELPKTKNYKKTLTEPRTFAAFAHEHEHYDEHREVAKTDPEEAMRRSKVAGKAMSEFEKDPKAYYSNPSERRARNVEYAVGSRMGIKGSELSGSHNFLNHLAANNIDTDHPVFKTIMRNLARKKPSRNK